ncbi:MAG: HEAT repeat domain-containing protein [Planctomycetes bacterium]|nr:HEAT repeat domain-containing protein [Planctomycetota bacterium]
MKLNVYLCALCVSAVSMFSCSSPKPSISSTDPDLRHQWLMKSARSGDVSKYLKLYAELVTDDPDPLVRALAARYVGKFNYKEGTPALIKALADPSPYVRQDAAVALGEIGDTSAVTPLLKTLEDDTSSEVRRSTAQSLGKIGDSKAVDGLIHHLEDVSPGVAYAALQSLKTLTKQDFGKDIKAWEKWKETLR